MSLIGKNPNQIPLNQHLGKLAFQNEVTFVGSDTTTPTVASASTITISSKFTFVSGTTTISTILIPNSQYIGGTEITIIPTGNWVTDTSGNIANIIAADLNVPIILIYDNITSKWYTTFVGSKTNPNSYPSLVLDFVNNKDLDPRIDFTRSSGGSYTNANGLISYAAANQPRFDYNPVTEQCKGLLIEESRVNLLTYSEDFDNWNKIRATISSNVAISPDGTLTADKLVEDNSASTTHETYITVNKASSPITYTYSVFLKAATRTQAMLLIDNTDGSGGYRAYFDLLNGTVISSALSGTFTTGNNNAIQSVGNGWYRCSITVTTDSYGAIYAETFLAVAGNYAYTGDGTSGIYMWGTQLEVGAFATSYIPTLGSFTSRSSTATYYGSDGLLKTAAANTARINYNPANLSVPGKILLEPAATNLALYSEQFDNAAWTKANITVTANATTAPDGTTTADKIIETTTANVEHIIYIGRNTSNETLTLSVYAKAAERTKIQMGFSNFLNFACAVSFDLSTGTIFYTSASNADYINIFGNIVNVGNGWFRCSVSATKLTSNTVNNPYIDVLSASGAATYTGDGTSGVYVWGAQLETGTSATSYFPTTSTTGPRSADVASSATTLQSTRSPDIASISGTNFSNWYNQNEGSFSVIFTPKGSVSSRTILSINNGTGSNYIELRYSSGSLIQYDAATNGIEQWNITSSGYTTLDTTYSYAGSYKLNDIASSINGNLNSTDSSAVIPIPTKLTIAVAYSLSSEFFSGTIANLTYYPKRLSNIELQTLSIQ